MARREQPVGARSCANAAASAPEAWWDRLPWLPVASSNVRRVCYPEDEYNEFEAQGTLYVQFHNNGVYAYERVPRRVWIDLHARHLRQGSIGSFVAQRLRGRYATTRVDK